MSEVKEKNRDFYQINDLADHILHWEIHESRKQRKRHKLPNIQK